jgi:cytochrome c553
MLYSNKIAALLAGVTVMFSGHAFAVGAMGGIEGNLDNGKKIYLEGKGDVVPACITCHGEKALGEDSMGTPRLAGQSAKFIVKQLNDFANDKRQDTTMYIMNANAKGLTEQERRDVAVYVRSLKLPVVGSDINAVKDLGNPVGKRYLGKSIAQFGIPERGVPACHSCHGFNGRGAFPVYPMIGGQKYVYLINQLKKWRDGSRANDPMAQMQKVAKKLTDEDIYNVATFLTSAPPTTMGNSRVPEEVHSFPSEEKSE